MKSELMGLATQVHVALAMASQYAGAKSNKTSLKAWEMNPGSADADTPGDLPTLRSRSRDDTRSCHAPPYRRPLKANTEQRARERSVRMAAKLEPETLDSAKAGSA